MRRDRRALVAVLRGFPLFDGLDGDDLEALVRGSDDFRLPARWSLLQEGTPADAVYVLTDGTARVFRSRVAVTDVGRGDVVGEMAMFEGGQRLATVSSVTSISALRVDYGRLAEIMANRPQLADALHSLSAQRQAA